MRGTYIGNNRVLVSPVWGGLLLVPADDLSISPVIISTGAFEPALTNYFLKQIRPGAVVFDLGAHIGYYSVMLAHRVGESGRVYAYEANPATFAFLRDNINMNYLKNRARLLNKAAFSSPGRITFHVTERFNCNSSIYPREESYALDHMDNIREIQVETEALDCYVGELGHIDLVKMDIEGAEYQALRGMNQLLQRRAVDTVVFEFAPTMLRADCQPLYRLLKELQPDYSFYVPTNEGEASPVTLDAVFAAGWVPAVIMKRQLR